MFRFLARLRPTDDEVLISGENINVFMRNVFTFLGEHDIWSKTVHIDIRGDTIDRFHDCLTRVTNISSPPENLSCPMAFDSWLCWNYTQPGTLATLACPKFDHLGYSEKNEASRFCTESGHWWHHPDSNKTWSNYTSCPDREEQQFRDVVNMLAIIGLSMSLALLMISIIIFCGFSSLQCGRIQMHKNLLLSLAMSCALWLLWYKLVLFDTDVWPYNPVWCRILHVVKMYFTMASYFWMLCEGIYLQVLLSATFNLTESTATKRLIIFGWLGSLLVMVPYVTFRSFSQEENWNCWIDLGHSQWLLGIPVSVILVINVAILIHVILVLRRKLQTSETTSDLAATAKSVKAAFLLIPILGLHFLILPVRPTKGSNLEKIYEICSTLFSFYQGVLVSLLFCFLNNEVMSAVVRKWQRFKAGPRRASMDILATDSFMRTRRRSGEESQNVQNKKMKTPPNIPMGPFLDVPVAGR